MEELVCDEYGRVKNPHLRPHDHEGISGFELSPYWRRRSN